jgi:serine protease Do
VLDADSKVVGINTHRIGDGFYLARAADDALRTRVSDLLEGRSPSRRTIGVAIAPADVATRLRSAVGLPERQGLLVRGLDESGPAARAGVQVGDLIVAAAGKAIVTIDDLQHVLDTLSTETVELGLVRGADELTVELSFTTPAAEDTPLAD